jgi:hypothetical protein
MRIKIMQHQAKEFWQPILTFLMCKSTRYSALMSWTENTTPNYQSSLIRPITTDVCLWVRQWSKSGHEHWSDIFFLFDWLLVLMCSGFFIVEGEHQGSDFAIATSWVQQQDAHLVPKKAKSSWLKWQQDQFQWLFYHTQYQFDARVHWLHKNPIWKEKVSPPTPCGKDIDHPKFFQSKTITPKRMVDEWHLSEGNVAQLMDNVSTFNRYLANR